MMSFLKALLFGLLIWLVPFVVAVVIFPLRESARPLFESIMPVTVTAICVVCAVLYLQQCQGGYVRAGVRAGLLWFAMSILIDAPLMLFAGPMKMTIGEYFADIGLTYLIIPLITVGISVALARNELP